MDNAPDNGSMRCDDDRLVIRSSGGRAVTLFSAISTPKTPTITSSSPKDESQPTNHR